MIERIAGVLFMHNSCNDLVNIANIITAAICNPSKNTKPG